jgi:hypothetical protein
MTTKTIREFGMLHQFTDDFVSDSGVDHAEFLNAEFKRMADRDGYEVYEMPTHEWLDLDDPKNILARQSMTFEDDEGVIHEPCRWLVRSLGKVT